MFTHFAVQVESASVSTLVQVALVVLSVVLALHLLLDLLVLRRRRREREAKPSAARLNAVAELSVALARARDREEVGRVLLDTLNELIGSDFAGLVLIDEAAKGTLGLIARSGGRDLDWFSSLRGDLRKKNSGVGRAY
jgi:K+-sensing histidine kinase KdpD